MKENDLNIKKLIVENDITTFDLGFLLYCNFVLNIIILGIELIINLIKKGVRK